MRWLNAPPPWLRWVEVVAVAVGMGTVVHEFGIERPRDRELRDVRLHATVATVANEANKEAASHVVQRILALMHRERADMRGISIPGITFRTAKFVGVDWSDAYMRGVAFRCTDREEENIEQREYREIWGNQEPDAVAGKLVVCSRLKGARFTGAHLIGAKFYHTDLSHSRLNHANLTEATFYDVDSSDATFFGARMVAIRADNVDFSRVRFTRPPSSESPALPFFDCLGLSEKEIRCSRLEDVDFSGAQLPNVIIGGASIRNANFTDAGLRHVKFGCGPGVHFFAPRPGFAQCTTIDRGCFRNADLSDTWFLNVRIENSDFSGARLAGASFQDVTFKHVIFPDEQEAAVSFDAASRDSLNADRRTVRDSNHRPVSPCTVPEDASE